VPRADLAVPVELGWLAEVVTPHWPDGDEQALRRCGRAWRDAAAQVRAMLPDADRAAGRALAALHGRTAEGVRAVWDRFTVGDEAHLEVLASACAELADWCDGTADVIEYTKKQLVGLLVELALEIAVLIALSPGTFGGSLALIRSAEAATRLRARAVAGAATVTVALAGQRGIGDRVAGLLDAVRERALSHPTGPPLDLRTGGRPDPLPVLGPLPGGPADPPVLAGLPSTPAPDVPSGSTGPPGSVPRPPLGPVPPAPLGPAPAPGAAPMPSPPGAGAPTSGAPSPTVSNLGAPARGAPAPGAPAPHVEPPAPAPPAAVPPPMSPTPPAGPEPALPVGPPPAPPPPAPVPVPVLLPRTGPAQPTASRPQRSPGPKPEAEPEFVDPRYLARVAEVEQALTPVLHDVAEEAGGWLWGLVHRRKTTDAIGRKLAGQLRDSPDLTMREALAALPDAIRYTIGLPDDGYAAAADRVLTALTARGYRSVRVANSWDRPDRYPGIVSWWAEPGTGQLFEVQLHTEGSYAVHTGEHELTYHRILLTPDGPDQDALLERLRAALAEVAVPAGAADIGR
jgi:hypothetical protein